MQRVTYHNVWPALTWCGGAAIGVGTGLGTLLIGGSLVVASGAFALGALALAGFRGDPTGHSRLGASHWSIRYGALQIDLPLSDVEAVSLWPEGDAGGGDQIFVEMRDGQIVPLPDPALPPLATLQGALFERNIPIKLAY